jgi:protein TonB
MSSHRIILILGAALVAIFSFLPLSPLAGAGSPATPPRPGTAADPAHPVTAIAVEELSVPAVTSDPVPPGLPETVWVRVAVTVALDDQARPVDAIAAEPMLHGGPVEEPVAPEAAAPFLKAAVRAALDSSYRFLEPPSPSPRALYRGMFQLHWAIPGGSGHPAPPLSVRGDSAVYTDGVLAIRGPSEDAIYLKEGPSASHRYVSPGRVPATPDRVPAPPRAPRPAEAAPARPAVPAPPAPPLPPDEGLLIAGVDTSMPTLIQGTRAEPLYPEEARKAGIAGKVILQVTIEEDGTVGDIEVLRAPDPDAGLTEAAIEAIRMWRYEPAMKDGRPVAALFTVMIEFRLDSQKPDNGEPDPGLT